jgi:hypothetical protein
MRAVEATVVVHDSKRFLVWPNAQRRIWSHSRSVAFHIEYLAAIGAFAVRPRIHCESLNGDDRCGHDGCEVAATFALTWPVLGSEGVNDFRPFVAVVFPLL